MKSRVRFHLGGGRHKGHWQVRSGGTVSYHDPNVTSLVLRGCRLVNGAATAGRIFRGGDKTPCAWIECESIETRAPQEDDGLPVLYNPRVAPHWVADGKKVDGARIEILKTSGRRVFAGTGIAL